MGLTRTEATIFISQTVCILFYGLFVVYEEGVNANSNPANDDIVAKKLTNHYPFY